MRLARLPSLLLLAVAAAAGLASCEPSDSTASKWARQLLDKSNALLAVWGASVDDVYVFGSGGLILYTRDRGTTWIERPVSTTAALASAWGSGADDVYAVGGSTVVHSTSRGVSWAVYELPGRTLVAVWGNAADDVYIAADGGIVLHSVDRGLTWTEQTTGAASLRGLWGPAKGSVFAVGAKGVVAHTSDGGASWKLLDTGVTADLTAVWGTATSDLFVVAAGVGGQADFLYSPNGGQTWQKRIALKLPSVEKAGIVALWGSSNNNLYALHSSSWVYHTQDGGVNWEPELFEAEAELGGLWGTSATSIYVVGTRKMDGVSRSLIGQRRP